MLQLDLFYEVPSSLVFVSHLLNFCIFPFRFLVFLGNGGNYMFYMDKTVGWNWNENQPGAHSFLLK